MTSERLLNMSIEVLYPTRQNFYTPQTNFWLRPWFSTKVTLTVHCGTENMHECITFRGQKIKGQGHGGIKYAGNRTFRAC